MSEGRLGPRRVLVGADAGRAARRNDEPPAGADRLRIGAMPAGVAVGTVRVRRAGLAVVPFSCFRIVGPGLAAILSPGGAGRVRLVTVGGGGDGIFVFSAIGEAADHAVGAALDDGCQLRTLKLKSV